MLNVHSSLPLRIRAPSPLVLLCVLTVRPSRNDDPTITTSFATAASVQADLTSFEINLFALADERADFHVTTPVLPNELTGTCFRVQRDEAEAGRHRGRDRHPCRRSSRTGRPESWRGRPRRGTSFRRGPRSARPLASSATTDRRVPPVDHALDHQRRAFELELGARAEVVGLNRHATSSWLKLLALI